MPEWLIILDIFGKIYNNYILPPQGRVQEINALEHDHRETIQRLKTVEGHIRGIQKMLENDQYCIDIIQQIQAVQSALNKISTIILDGHLNTCLTTAVKGDDPQERQRVLREITEVFETANKL